MSEHTPTAAQVEQDWISAMITESPYWDALSEEEAQARWDRFIAAEKRKWQAEAWDEGFDRGFYSGQLMPDADASESPIENPYRKEQP